MMNTVGMIFAAGVGSRLKPFTDFHPKALVEVGDKPMLQRVIESMGTAGIKSIVINVHHFAGQIIDFLRANSNFGLNILISDESESLLETGGGLLKAMPLFNNTDNILIHNADILTDLDLSLLVDFHKSSGNDVTMWVKKRTSSRQLYFDDEMRLRGWENLSTKETKPKGFLPQSSLRQLAFSGVQVVSPHIFPTLIEYGSVNDQFSIIPFYLSNINRLNIVGYESDASWFDIGKPASLEAARKAINV